MAAGKQVSFAKGEVSQKERYKSETINYQTGLNKLRNMYVRKGGGVSNISGSILETTDNFFALSNLFKSPGGNLKCWFPSYGERTTVKIMGDFTFYKVKLPVGGTVGAAGIEYAVMLSYYSRIYWYRTFETLDELDSFDLNQIDMIDSGTYYIITPEFSAYNYTSVGSIRLGLHYILTEFGSTAGDTESSIDIASGVKQVGYINKARLIDWYHTQEAFYGATGVSLNPVSYDLFEVDREFGVESLVSNKQSTVGRTPTGQTVLAPFDLTNIVEPYSDSLASIIGHGTVKYTSTEGISRINVYRSSDMSSNSEITPISGLVASFNIAYSASGTSIEYTDASQLDISVGPPTDYSMIAPPERTILGSVGVRSLSACMYQGRLFAGAIPFSALDRGAKAGEVFASKIGAPIQFTSPQISRDAEAFRFSIPTEDNSVVVSVVEYHSLIVISEKACYAITGSSGIVTPSSINPKTLVKIGGSSTIKPVKSSQSMYYVNSDHSRVIKISFNEQYGYAAEDISTSFEHLLDIELVDMKVISGNEDHLYILRADGKIIQLTINDGNIEGCSLLDLGVWVAWLSVSSRSDIIDRDKVTIEGRYLREVLSFGAFHNGSMYTGYIPFRVDNSLFDEFAIFDGAYYGGYLKNYGPTGYGYVSINAEGPTGSIVTATGAMYSNIETNIIDTWTSGTSMNVNIFNFDPKGSTRIRFFYTDGDEEKSILMYVSSYSAATIAGATTMAVGTFDQDIPEALQNVWLSATPTPETSPSKSIASSRFQPLFNSISLSGDSGFYPGILNSFSEDIYYIDSVGDLVLNSSLPATVPLSIVADGEVLSSPLNPNKNTIEASVSLIHSGVNTDPIVISGSIELPEYYGLIRFGRPITSEFETLDIEATGERTLTSGNKLVTSVGMALYNTRGGFAGTTEGDDLGQLSEMQFRKDGDLSKVLPFFSGVKEQPINNNYNDNGRVYIKNVDPVAITILSVYPKGVSSGD